MRAFLLISGLLLSVDSSWCMSCLPRLGYVCKEIPTSYPPDMSSLVLWLSNVGEINSTVFNNTKLASVTSLTLEKSGITAIAPGAFDKFQNLKVLDLYSNELTLVTSDWFNHKEILENLTLSSNRIAALSDDSFLGLVGLLRLNLSHNQIQSISSGTFRSLRKLSQLDLSNNKLSHLSVDTLRSVNSTKISLGGNPWNCSYTQFAVYLRELQRTSLLENEMEVLCDSPACLKGVPVWNVSKCVETITVDPTTGNNHTPQSTSVKPQPNRSVITSLIVLYHRKQEQKHLQTIKPSPEEPESGNQAHSHYREAIESSKNVELFVPGLKTNYYRSEVILGLDKVILDSEKVSQIYQIYGTGIHQTRGTSNRAKSAGPVLSRTDVFDRGLETEVEDQKLVRVVSGKRENGVNSYEELFDGTKETSGEQTVCGSEEKLQGMNRMQTNNLQDEIVNHGNDGDFKATLETQKGKENKGVKVGEKEENSLDENEVLHNDHDTGYKVDDDEDNLSLSLPKQETLQQAGDDTVQLLQDSETLPYLTIGTNTENHISEPDKIPAEASARKVSSKPIRRVLTWPPTAVQWKKQWEQTQQILSVFPGDILGARCNHQISTFPTIKLPVSPQSIRQNTESGSIPVPSGEEGTHFQTVKPLKKMCESVIHSYTQCFPSSPQNYSDVNEAQSHVITHPVLSVNSDLVQSSQLSGELKAVKEESVNSRGDSENIKRSSRGQKMIQLPKGEQVLPKSETRLRGREREHRTPLRGKRDHSGSGSMAPPSGGSPSDDSLLVDNEYAFIDLLHEVVENHGRWTRERWRQSHINKQKHKQPGTGH